MLVLGDNACDNGLGTSLLQRLHDHYKEIVHDPASNPYTG